MGKMNQILINTRKRGNIELLRARDYWFNRARLWWRAAFTASLITPILVAISYFPIPILAGFFSDWRDIIVAISALTLFFLGAYFESKSDTYRSISNSFREQYDINVLSVPPNPFIIKSSKSPEVVIDGLTYQQMLEKGAREYRDHQKYEAWYEEIFSNDHWANVICCQMDNVLYTVHSYKDALIYYRFFTCVLLLFIIIPAVLFQDVTVGILVFVSSFDILTTCLESIRGLRSEIDTLNGICKVFDNKAVPLSNADEMQLFVRELQDAIATYRESSIYIPRYIRLKNLREDSAYYKELNSIKAMMYKGKQVSRPEKPSEIVIFDESEEKTYTLENVHSVLREMLSDVTKAFTHNGINYTLDGGSLIGAVRKNENSHFVFWDDDIDITLPYAQLERAKAIIQKELGSKYDVQDYDNDPAYSPRLANFRVRDKHSITTEKDSLLFENYLYRGIFIDVYAYSPILYNRTIDSLYRRAFIHPLNLRILKTENASVRKNDIASRIASKDFGKYLRLRQIYLKRVSWYLDHARNEKYVTYTPTYIFNEKKPGPYIRSTDMKASPKTAILEHTECQVPVGYDAVLTAYYGEWRNVPFKTIEQMKADCDEHNPNAWYSDFVQAITPLKHLRNVEIDF